MFFVIHCLDYPDVVQRRLALYDEHKAYLSASGTAILIAGPICRRRKDKDRQRATRRDRTTSKRRETAQQSERESW
jgi:uncharacterized protein YciI